MISVDEAKRLINLHLPKPKSVHVDLAQACGHVLARQVRAGFDLPSADNSAMDGFALRSEDVRLASVQSPVVLRICATVQAGATRLPKIGKGECCRIMTGAVIPPGADTVIAQEDAQCEDHTLAVNQPLQPGKHIRFQGEEVKKGEVVLRCNTEIGPGCIGILATLGIARVPVFAKPKVAIVTTGNELVAPGKKRIRGQIFDSNSWMVRAALLEAGFQVVFHRTLSDKLKVIKNTVKQALQKADVVIMTGGVSVGQYDLVKDVLKSVGTREIFWKVSQKPGKPLFVGQCGKRMIFALPGNPAAVFVCFYEYVFPALRMMMGAQQPALAQVTLRLTDAIKPDPVRALFLKSKTDRKNSTVQALGNQGSHMLTSLRDTTGLIVVAPGQKSVAAGDQVSVDLLPGLFSENWEGL